MSGDEILEELKRDLYDEHTAIYTSADTIDKLIKARIAEFAEAFVKKVMEYKPESQR